MPAEHAVDTHNRIIITTWTGEVVDNDLVKALSDYHLTLRGKASYASFDEIVDFSQASHYHLSISGIQRLVEIAAATDVPGTRTKLAFVVKAPVAYGLARMYQTYRSLIPAGSKILRIFRTYDEALRWVVTR